MDVVVKTSKSAKVDFSDLQGGVYRVYAFSIKGALLNPVGQHLDTAVIASLCYEPSINYVLINLAEFDAGMISTTDGETQLDVCTGDQSPNIIRLQTDVTITDLQHYVLTDTFDQIIMILSGDEIDLNTLPTGVCRIYGVAASGPITAQVGDHLLVDELTAGCHDLSDNFIEIKKTFTDGGSIQTDGGEQVVFLCPGNGVADLIKFQHTSTANVDYKWVITDQNDVITNILDDPSYDFENTPNGTCRVYGVSYTGTFINFTGTNINQFILSSACFDISDNFIEIHKSETIGGQIQSRFGRDREYICPDDTIPDVIVPTLINSSNSKHAYILTDTFGAVRSFFLSTPIILTDQDPGICRVYGVSYTGNLTVSPGEDILFSVLSDDCYDLTTNYMELFKFQAQGGMISLMDGSTGVELCVGDGEADIVMMKTSSQSPLPYKYIITDQNNRITNILGTNFFDFDLSEGGMSRIWGVSYTAMLETAFGENILEVALSDDCFELSSNYIEVTKYFMGIEEIRTEDGQQVVYTCPGDGQPNIVSFKITGSTNTNLVYLITDTDNVVSAIRSQADFDFESDVEGTYRVWALAYSGDLLIGQSMDIDTASLASGCSQLTDNYLTVHRYKPEIGTPTTLDGADKAIACIGTSLTEVGVRIDTRSMADFTYIITDRNDRIIGFSNDDLIDFSIENPGKYKIYAASFTGRLIADIGDPVDAVLSDDCYDLSDLSVLVHVQEVDGALVFTDDDKSIVYICPDDTQLDSISFVNTSELNTSYQYVITDEDFNVLGVSTDTIISFNNVGAGDFRVWGVSYTGDFILKPGDHIINDAASDACWDVSNNFVSVQTQFPNWEGLQTLSGQTTIDITVGDGMPDIVQLSDEGNLFGFSAYVVTKPDGTITGFTMGNSVEFDGITPGTCLIFGVAYTGSLSVVEGKKILDIALSDDCFDISDNAVTVNKLMGRPPVIADHIPIRADYIFTEQSVLLTSNKDESQTVQWSIQNVDGIVLFSDQIQLDQWHVIDLANYNLKSGIFFLTISTQGYMTGKKLLIIR